MNPMAFSARRLVFAVALASCFTIVLMGPAFAADPHEGYITDALVGQGNAPTTDDGLTDGWLHSEVGESARDAQAASERLAASEPFIRDSQIGQVPGASLGSTQPGSPVLTDDSPNYADEIALAGGLTLAFLMGIALALSVGRYTHRTA